MCVCSSVYAFLKACVCWCLAVNSTKQVYLLTSGLRWSSYRTSHNGNVLQPSHGVRPHAGVWEHPVLGALRRLLGRSFPRMLSRHIV